MKSKAASETEPLLSGVRPGRITRSSLFSLAHFIQQESHGSSVLEFALVLPMLLALLTGTCACGIAFNNQLTLNRAVGVGAQYLQLARTSTLDPCQDAMTAIKNSAPNLTASSISLSLNLNGTTKAGNSCSGAQSYMVQGQPVTVTATYPCTLMIYGTTGLATCQLSAKVTEYEY